MTSSLIIFISEDENVAPLNEKQSVISPVTGMQLPQEYSGAYPNRNHTNSVLY